MTWSQSKFIRCWLMENDFPAIYGGVEGGVNIAYFFVEKFTEICMKIYICKWLCLPCLNEWIISSGFRKILAELSAIFQVLMNKFFLDCEAYKLKIGWTWKTLQTMQNVDGALKFTNSLQHIFTPRGSKFAKFSIYERTPDVAQRCPLRRKKC